MKSLLVSGMMILFLLVTHPLSPIANASVASTGVLTLTQPPKQSVVGSIPVILVSYASIFNGSLAVFVWAPLNNQAGQTVGVFIGSMGIGYHQTETAFVPLFNLPNGTYFAVIFATTITGIVVSNSYTINVSIG
ncbi:MAG: hypothetical protein LYZ70_00045 [Nitrososphaerales archaeon]|nr:hypothetical protein [Nitrososphaerales archaeon]